MKGGGSEERRGWGCAGVTCCGKGYGKSRFCLQAVGNTLDSNTLDIPEAFCFYPETCMMCLFTTSDG